MAVLRSLLLLFVIFSLGNAQRLTPARRCPRGWNRLGYRCFKYFSQSVQWASAERLCQSLGANLASVHDKEENDFLLGLMPASTRTWIGAHDGEQDGEWFWSDGSLFNHNNWCSEEPNNSDGPENCLEIDWSSDRCWNDASCSTSMSYLCVLDVRVPR
ncbi:ladderlectin-like [Pimephales promelas]|uniref:ladderlectin-like n=1 Tax=Pimephales promelas TaxID=90988 RepID=UPI0019559ADF|nr:ladderlectin-like [Pimephales promelas]